MKSWKESRVSHNGRILEVFFVVDSMLWLFESLEIDTILLGLERDGTASDEVDEMMTHWGEELDLVR